MVNSEKWYNALRARKFYLVDDRILDKFLEEVEEFSKQHNTPEVNYFYAFEKKLDQVEKKIVPVVGPAQISLDFTKERNKDPAKRYRVIGIRVLYNKNLEK
jgi:hypothetical protein